jgi:hypothetical protein
VQASTIAWANRAHSSGMQGRCPRGEGVVFRGRLRVCERRSFRGPQPGGSGSWFACGIAAVKPCRPPPVSSIFLTPPSSPLRGPCPPEVKAHWSLALRWLCLAPRCCHVVIGRGLLFGQVADVTVGEQLQQQRNPTAAAPAASVS